MFVILTIIVQVSQLIFQQSLWLINSKNASSFGLTLFIELSLVFLFFFFCFRGWSILGAYPLAIECILFNIIYIRNAVLGDYYLLLLRL